MVEFVQHPAVQALAWALVHFLWQGAAIGLLAWLGFRACRSASARYLVGVGALAAMLAAPIVTVTWLAQAPPPLAAAGPAAWVDSDVAAIGAPPPETAPSAVAGGTFADRAAIARAAVVGLWLVGVAIGLIRLMGGWVVARRLASRAVEPASAAVQGLARHVADRLALGRDVRILQSTRVAVPVMIGWVRPAVVLPAAALAGLTPTQLEAILAHELAHVRRHDFPVNVLQSVAEALLFFHPAVWWVSSRVRAERELCCDDLAVSLCDRVVYATALGDLAALASPRVALAATDGDLLARVRRVLQPEMADPRARLTPGFAIGLVAALVGPVAFVAAQGPVTHAPGPVTHAQGTVTHAQGTVTHARAHGEAQSVAHARPADNATIHARNVTLATNEHGPLEVHAQHVTVTRHDPAEVPAAHAAQSAPQTAAERERARAAAEAARQAELQAELLARHRAEVQDQAAREQTQAARVREVQAALDQLARQRQLHEKGLVSEAQLRDLAAALEVLKAQGDAGKVAEARIKAAHAEHARLLQLLEKGLIARDQVAAKEAELAVLERHRQAAAGLAADRQAGSASTEQAMRELAARLKSLDEAADATLVTAATIRSGDVLHVTIDGEPDLPTTYRVTPQGTIRLPFVGAIQVASLSVDQVRAAIGKALADRRLGKVDQVRVTVVRGGVAR